MNEFLKVEEALITKDTMGEQEDLPSQSFYIDIFKKPALFKQYMHVVGLVPVSKLFETLGVLISARLDRDNKIDILDEEPSRYQKPVREYTLNYKQLIFKFKDCIIDFTYTGALSSVCRGWIIVLGPSVEAITHVQEDINKLQDFVIVPIHNAERNLHIITKSAQGRLQTRDFPIKDPKLDIESHYADGFLQAHDKILNTIKADDHGLILLHGHPGTGKTFYLRHLVHALAGLRKVIYVPPDMTHVLEHPDFTDFLAQESDSVFIIEDAENVLSKREGGDNQAVSNILNMTDGLLADCFKVQIICTFNTDLAELDEALLRKGRLSCIWKFEPLSREKAEILGKKLGLDTIETKDGYLNTLADLYNAKEENFHKKAQKQGIGFLQKA